MPGHANRNFVIETAEPGQLQGVDARCRLAEQRIERDIADGRADRSAVLGRDIVDVIHGLASAARRKILDDDLRIAGNVAAHVPPEQPAILVVAPSRRRADEHVDLLAAVEIARWLGASNCGMENADENRERCGAGTSRHCLVSYPKRRKLTRLPR